jgi:hypothetical protein
MVIRVEGGIAAHQGRFQEPTEMAVFEQEEGASEPSTALGGGSTQMDLFTSDDFGESSF